MTAGLDRRWRRLAAEAVVRPGDAVLDACCGTGDLAIACARAGGRVTGLDFSERMLERARRKAPELEWVAGDLLSLPFADANFDAATVGFGVRNVDDLERALRELRRVLRGGGRLGILEITRPRGLLAPFYRFWFDGVVPLLGKLLPGGAAYSYLPASVRRFPGPQELAELIGAAGFAVPVAEQFVLPAALGIVRPVAVHPEPVPRVGRAACLPRLIDTNRDFSGVLVAGAAQIFQTRLARA